jgi:hypothetical protein
MQLPDYNEDLLPSELNELSPMKTPKPSEDPVELQRWIESRRRNFPTRGRIEAKHMDSDRRQELGIKGINEDRGFQQGPELSKIEIKLRKKLKLIVG